MNLHLDFETRSTVDLKKAGVYPYAWDPTTDVWCAAWAVGDDHPSLWLPGDPVPEPLLDPQVEVHAHNAAFERIITWLLMHRRYGWPRLPREQWHCTAARAAAMALPRSLDNVARALRLPQKKDAEGHRLMLQMAKPRKPRKGEPKDVLLWWDDEERRQRLYDYCIQDVIVEREVGKRIRPLSQYEREVYLLDQRMNDRGVYLDVPLIQAAQKIVDEGMSRANAELADLTDGAATKVTQPARILEWAQEAGVDADNMTKATVRDLLAGDDLETKVRRVLEIRQGAAKSSTAKLNSMQLYAGPDWRARGLLLYHGAGTGRWSGKGPQPQNFPRPEFKLHELEPLLDLILAGDYEALAEKKPPLVVVASALRSMLRAEPGHRLIAADFGQIEARVLAWIAEQEDLVQMFAEGAKIYEEMGALIFGIPVDEVTKDGEERQVGKNTVLGCGFQMGWETYQRQAYEQTGIWLPDELCQKAVKTYRSRFASIPRFWGDIDMAAMRAVQDPGSIWTVGRNNSIQYQVAGPFLWCRLPSGRFLCYADPKLKEKETPWGEMRVAVSFMGVNSVTGKWQRQYGYGGFWTENVVQAMARDLMVASMLRVEKAGYDPILTVHDEVVTEVPDGVGNLEEFVSLMKVRPRWAAGLPVAADGWEGERYRK